MDGTNSIDCVNSNNDLVRNVATQTVHDVASQTTLTSQHQHDEDQVLVIATRIHLGEATSIPSNLNEQIQQFYNFCNDCSINVNTTNHSNQIHIYGVIAVDAKPIVQIPSSSSVIGGDGDYSKNDSDGTGSYVVDGGSTTANVKANVNPIGTSNCSLVDVVRNACTKAESNYETTTTDGKQRDPIHIHIIPVQPWGKYVPALNALLSYAAQVLQQHNIDKITNGSILYCSLETSTTSVNAIQLLLSNMNYNTTLVCGAVLSGHEYHGTQHSSIDCDKRDMNNNGDTSNSSTITTEPVATTLNGRTTPWNTLALWNISKLSKIGFLPVSDGICIDVDEMNRASTNSDNTNYSNKMNPQSIAGVEEVITISVLQKLYNPHIDMVAKLIYTPSIAWDIVSFQNDPKRQVYHEQKMQSKLQRAQQQLQILSLDSTPGIVYHY
jgi:hypothetical protein